MRLAYADPPYPGQARRHYLSDPSGIPAAEVDHAALVDRLRTFDGWALSTSTPALHAVLPLVPEARIAAWCKPFAVFRPGRRVQYAWEPVLFVTARPALATVPSARDWLSANITLRTGTHGAKPEAFGLWLLDLLGAEPGDELHDLYPGSGAVAAAWAAGSLRYAAELGQ